MNRSRNLCIQDYTIVHKSSEKPINLYSQVVSLHLKIYIPVIAMELLHPDY